MKLDYRKNNELGKFFGNANLVFTKDGNNLLSPVGNTVKLFQLVDNASRTLGFENKATIEIIALSNNNQMLLSIDESGQGLIVRFGGQQEKVLYRFGFNVKKGKVRAALFSPDDKYFAIAQGKQVIIYKTPPMGVQFSAQEKYHVYAKHTNDVTSLDWSYDGRFIVSGSKDGTAIIWSLHKIPGFMPITLTGHRTGLMGAYFASSNGIDRIYTVVKDGAVFKWKWEESVLDESSSEDEYDDSDEESSSNDDENIESIEESSEDGSDNSSSSEEESEEEEEDEEEEEPPMKRPSLMDQMIAQKEENSETESDEEAIVPQKFRMTVTEGKWIKEATHLFELSSGRKLSSVTFHKKTQMLVVGFASGAFGLFEMPSFTGIHTLSISQKQINSVVCNPSGDWLAFGSKTLGQLLVWEWQSESYVLKQQGHFFDVNCVAFSPDGRAIATGGDDGKMKLWNAENGFCYYTSKDHEASVNDISFCKNGQVVISSSSDGTVRAFDLVRYRNFRTMTAPTPCQFTCLSVDPSGEVVCAGCMDPPQICVWSLQTGRLVSVLSGHKGPITSIDFSTATQRLVSSSWDKTIRVWNVFETTVPEETFEVAADVLDVRFRPDGKEIAAAALNGQISLWDLDLGVCRGIIEGQRDIAGGRGIYDARTAKNSAANKHFSSLCYSADGAKIIAGGRSKFVCLYDVEERVLLKKYQLSHNTKIDGVLEKLNSKRLTEMGHEDGLPMDSDDEDEEEKNRMKLPGVRSGDKSSRTARLEVRSKQIRFSPDGRSFGVASTLGLLVFARDPAMVFDPLDISTDITKASMLKCIDRKQYVNALAMSLHLNEEELIHQALQAVPLNHVTLVAGQIPTNRLARFLEVLAHRITKSKHIEYHLSWLLAILTLHGDMLKQKSMTFLSSLRLLHKAILINEKELTKICNSNKHTLDFLATLASSASDVTLNKSSEDK